jgi:hypothetical protein
MEQAALSENTIYLNGGQRGLQIEIAPVFKPAMLLFNRDRPSWVIPPDGMTLFETMPD